MSTKPSVAMTPAEVRDFVDSKRFAAVAAIGVDGRIVARLVRHRHAGDVLEFDREGAAAALPAGAKACAVVDTFPQYSEIKGAMFRGVIEAGGGSGRLAIEYTSGFDFRKATPRR